MLAAFGVAVGLAAMFLESRTAGLWLFAVAVASVVIFRDMSRVELYETGSFLNAAVHRRETEAGLHDSRLSVPFYVLCDGVLLTALYFACKAMLSMPLTMMRRELLIYSAATFFALAVFKTYATVWSRATVLCYLRLFAGVIAGSSSAFIVLYYLTPEGAGNFGALSFVYALGACVLLGGLRFLRSAARDVFYMIDCARMNRRRNVSRVVVYGGGIRFQSFRRELVRRAYSSDRIIVGIVDDNPSLAGKYIGEVKVYGGIDRIEATVRKLKADAVVVACAPDDGVVSRLRETLAPTGVKLTVFGFSEREATA
jgi:FlaA1/EpsC-like NDP-sugar epimerase